MNPTISSGPPAGVHASNQAIADAYDSVPYLSKPFAQTTPEQMAIMGKLFGLQPPDITSARVLELGCSSGGNIIPLAARYPQLQALGIDLSQVQIAQGQQVLGKLGIENCTLKVLDIVHAQSEITGQFDYIICHGVFSWVPPAVRQAILNITRKHLSPSGVAYISYNVYPGWKQREVIREMMLLHAGKEGTPAQRLQRAKDMLQYTKSISTEQTTYGKLLREEAAHMSQAEDYYLFHEYLENENNPMYFKDFMALVANHQLAYLGEAGLSDMAPQRLGQDIHNTLARVSAGNILATEQYMDFFTNRTFRQTLLVHEAQAQHINRNLGPHTLKGFAINTALSVDPAFQVAPGQSALVQYKDSFGRSLTVNSPMALAMVQTLLAAKPHSVVFEDLVATVAEKVTEKAPGVVANALQAVAHAVGAELINLLVQNLVRLSLAPLPVSLPSPSPLMPTNSDTLCAFSLARIQAQMGQNWATNLLHQAVKISPVHQTVLAQLDGTRSRAVVLADLLLQLKDGRLIAHSGQERITDEAQLKDVAEQLYTQAINDLRQLAVLQ